MNRMLQHRLYLWREFGGRLCPDGASFTRVAEADLPVSVYDIHHRDDELRLTGLVDGMMGDRHTRAAAEVVLSDPLFDLADVDAALGCGRRASEDFVASLREALGVFGFAA